MMFWKLFRKFKKPKEENQKRESGDVRHTLDETQWGELHVDYALRVAFSGSEPWPREHYESTYIYGSAGKYFMCPTYEEYLQLFEKYRNMINEREYSSERYRYLE